MDMNARATRVNPTEPQMNMSGDHSIPGASDESNVIGEEALSEVQNCEATRQRVRDLRESEA